MAFVLSIMIYSSKCDGPWHNKADKAIKVPGRTERAAFDTMVRAGWGWSRAGKSWLCPACLDEDRAGK